MLKFKDKFIAQTGSMTNFIKICRYLVISLGLMLFVQQIAGAQSLLLPQVESYGGLVQNPGTVSGSFDSNVARLVVGAVLNVRYLLTAIAIALLVFAGFNLFTAQGDEGKWKTAKSTLIYSIIGLALVGLSGEIVRIFTVGKCAELGLLPASNMAGCVEGGFLKNPQAIIQRTTLFNKVVQYLITFIKYLLGSVAVLALLRNAIRMAANTAGDELEKDKKGVMASLLGLILVVISDPIINKVFFSIDSTRYPSVGGAEVGINYAQGVAEIVGFTNFLVTILTPIAILVIVAGGIMYITAGDNAESQSKAKRMIMLALGGIIIIYGAFAIVSTFISGQFDPSSPAIVNPAEKSEAARQSNNTTFLINSIHV